VKGVKRKEAIEKTKKEFSRKGNQDSDEKMKNRKAVGINGRPMVEVRGRTPERIAGMAW